MRRPKHPGDGIRYCDLDQDSRYPQVKAGLDEIEAIIAARRSIVAPKLTSLPEYEAWAHVCAEREDDLRRLAEKIGIPNILTFFPRSLSLDAIVSTKHGVMLRRDLPLKKLFRSLAPVKQFADRVRKLRGES